MGSSRGRAARPSRDGARGATRDARAEATPRRASDTRPGAAGPGRLPRRASAPAATRGWALAKIRSRGVARLVCASTSARLGRLARARAGSARRELASVHRAPRHASGERATARARGGVPRREGPSRRNGARPRPSEPSLPDKRDRDARCVRRPSRGPKKCRCRVVLVSRFVMKKRTDGWCEISRKRQIAFASDRRNSWPSRFAKICADCPQPSREPRRLCTAIFFIVPAP